MFTGIITHLGIVKSKSQNKLQIECPKDFIKKLSKGMSVAVDGICLTVVSLDKNSFAIDFMPETAKRTNIGYLKVKDEVDLELPATSDTFLAGHIVQGHIDGLAKLINTAQRGNSRLLKFWVSSKLSKYIVEKGSITLNGISLTIINASKDYFTVGIIPYTWERTMLHQIKKGDWVNIEVDILAKYLEKLIKR